MLSDAQALRILQDPGAPVAASLVCLLESLLSFLAASRARNIERAKASHGLQVTWREYRARRRR